MIKVSVIVPVYNTSLYLSKCLNSLVNQTLKDIEIIVINDGSTDNSLDIINEFKKDNKNIVIINDSNHGQGFARNRGIALAKGEFITFVDSDDFIDYDMLEKMYKVSKDYDVVVCDINKVLKNKIQVFKNYNKYSKEGNKNLMVSHQGPVARLYRKDLFNNIKFLEGVYYEDLGMIPVLAQKVNKVKYIEDAMYYYLIRNNSTMKQKKYNKKLEDIFTVIEYLNKEIDEKYNEELEYIYIEHLLYSASLRFLDFNKKDMVNKINLIMEEKFPNWKNNKYLKNKSKKFKLVCNLVYKNKYKTLKLIKKITGK